MRVNETARFLTNPAPGKPPVGQVELRWSHAAGSLVCRDSSGTDTPLSGEEVTAGNVQTALSSDKSGAQASLFTGPWNDDLDAENAGVAAGEIYKVPGGALAWREDSFSVSALSPILWLDPSTLDLADGASVSSLTDLSGNSRTATPSGTAPTFDAEGPSGMPWIVSPARTLLTPSFQHWPSKRGTWFVVYAPDTTVGTNQTFLGSFQGGTTPAWVIYANNEFADRYFFSNAFGTSPTRLQGDQAGEVVIRCVRRSSDTAYEWFRNATRQWDFTLADHTPAANPLRIGQSFTGRIGEIIGFAESLTDEQVARVSGYLSRRWAGGRPVNLQFEGDSQTFGANLSSDQDTYPAKVFAGLANPRVAIRNYGVSGNVWSNLESRAATVDATVSTKAQNILCVWCGTNEAYLNDAPTSLAAAESYLADRAAAGWQLVVLTAMDRTDASNETWRTAYNAGLRNLCSANGYVLADIAANPLIGAAGAYGNTTYFQVDGIHLNSTGNGVAAGITQSAIETIMV